MKPVLYLVTPDGWETQRLIDACASSLRAGASWIQYRDKSDDQQRRLAQAIALRTLTRQFGARLLINDDVELALACGADGVHLGEHDTSLAQARHRLGAQAVIGVSCYDQIERARAAADGGASYLAFGAFFPSPTKPLARRAQAEVLRSAHNLGLPLCAIGGIDAARCGELVQAGADLIAVVSAVFEAADPAQATRDLLESMAAGWSRRNSTRQMAH